MTFLPRVALDAMGGDRGPADIVAGGIQAAADFGDELKVFMVGDESEIRQYLPEEVSERLGIEVEHAAESVEMHESGSNAYRRKRDSSIGVATRMVAQGLADAIVSGGNTGAVVTSGLLGLGRIKGVMRPAIASIIPTPPTGHCLLLDVGANSDTKPANLLQWAIMGSIYAKSVYGIEKPRVGLLNIGEESSKGSELAQQAFRLLQDLAGSTHFIGNLEGRDILRGTADVVVCDGFTGNVILKFAESVVGMVVGSIRREVAQNLKYKFGALLMKPVFGRVRNRLNYEEYGGAPLLGVNGTVVIAHGSSSALAIRNAVRVAAASARHGVHTRIAEELARELHREEAAG